MTQTSPAEAIFFAALQRPPGERPACRDCACAGDPDLRGRIERMLAAQSHLGAFLDQSQEDTAPGLPPPGPPEPAEAAGAVRAGKYKLLERISEGGMVRSGSPGSKSRSNARWPSSSFSRNCRAKTAPALIPV